VITDQAKYRRHQRKKVLKKALKIGIWLFASVVAIIFIWYSLGVLFAPRPIE
jgi:hypothetical protein